MKRREFIEIVGGAIVTARTFPANAQQPPRIIILHSGFPKRTPIHLLLEVLGKLGYANGDIDILGGEGDPALLKTLVAQIRVRKPEVIIAITSPAALALKEAALNIPVVFAFLSDPVGIGLVENFPHPGGDFTGVTYGEAELGGKKLEQLCDAITGLTNVGVLWSSSLPGNAAAVESIKALALARKIELFPRQLKGVDDLGSAFSDAKSARVKAAIFMTDNVLFGQRKAVAELAVAHGIPMIHSFIAEVRDGGFLFYGPNDLENYRRAAALADKILRGARPNELPVETPTKFDLIVNLKTAKALGLDMPESFLLRADEVIE